MRINPLRVLRFGGLLISTVFLAWGWFEAYPSTLTANAVVGLCGFLLVGYAASALPWRRVAGEGRDELISPSDEGGRWAAVDLVLALVGIALICVAFWLAK
jgi:hypothetical protein